MLKVALLLTLAAACAPTPRTASRTAAAPIAAGAPTAAAAAKVVDDGLVLPVERHAVGDRFTSVADMSIKSRIEPSAIEAIRYDRNQDSETVVEVLEVDAQGKITRARITYTIDEVRSILNRKAQRDASVIAGKTYLVTHAADTITVTDDRGRTPPRAEVDAVRAQEYTSADDALQRMLGGHRWYLDQRVELGADALAVFNRAQRDPRSRYTAYARELRSLDGGVATFAIESTLEQGTNSGPLALTLNGTQQVDIATGRELRTSLRGPVRGVFGGAPVTGEAVMSFRTK